MDQATKYSNIPQELRNSARWVLWRLEDTEIDGKLRKRSKSPKQAQHPERNAQNNNPDHWCSLEAALAAEASLTASPEYKNEPNNKGIGLIIGPPFIGLDIDKVRDPDSGDTEQWALDLIARYPGTYAELSPSGKGFHLWFKGKAPEAFKNGKRGTDLEVYPGGRYFTMTGDVVDGSADECAQLSDAQVMQLLGEVEKRESAKKKSTSQLKSAKLTDLMTSIDFPDLSAAVQSLLTHLCYAHGDDPGRIAAEFEKSALYLRTHWKTKWHRNGGTFAAEQITKAIAFAQAHPRKSSDSDQVVEAMNAKVCMIEKPPTIYSIVHRTQLRREDFYLLYANELYQDSDGKWHESAKAWLRSQHRRQYGQLVYDPSERCDERAFNMFEGWGAEAQKGDIEPFLKLMHSLYADPADLRYALSWSGYPVKHPGTKLHTARIVISHEQGVGKGAEFDALKAIYGKHNVSEINDQDLEGQFNDWAENKQLISVPEIMVGIDARRNLADRLKNYITNPIITINNKYAKRYALDTCANFLFHSNHPEALIIEDTDRRYHVVEMHGKGFKENQQFWKDYYSWLLNGGASSLRYYFMHEHDYSDFNPNAPAPDNGSKADMKRATSTPLEGVVRDLRDQPESFISSPCGFVTLNDLLVVVRHELDEQSRRFLNSKSLSNALRRVGFKVIKPTDYTNTDQVRIDGKLHRMWALRELPKMKAAELQERYEKPKYVREEEPGIPF